MSEKTTPKKAAVVTTAKVTTTAKTEVTLGKAAQSLEQSAKRMEEGLSVLEDFKLQLSDLDLQIATKESRLEELEVQLKQKVDANRVELALTLKEDEASAVTSILSKGGMIAVPVDELERVKKEAYELKANFDKEVKAEVAKAEAVINRNAKHAADLADKDFIAKEAENKAKITNLEDKVQFLLKANYDLTTKLDKALEANVSIAEASKGSNINLGGK